MGYGARSIPRPLSTTDLRRVRCRSAIPNLMLLSARSLCTPSNSAPTFCRAGRKHSNEWRCGSIHGEAGNSLGVHLSGGRAGWWADLPPITAVADC